MHLFYSDSDWLATGRDVEGFLLKELAPGIVQAAHKLTAFNHNDFLWGLRAPQEVYAPIVDEIWRSERHEEGISGNGGDGRQKEEAGREDAFVLDQLQQNAYGQRRRKRR